MAVIRKIDTIGVKTLLSKGEFGLDMYTAGGDTGRVYIGTGTENIMLARIDDLGATEVVATAGQTLVSVVNSASMILRIDNVAQTEGVDYTIVDGNTISMITPLVGGEVISAIDTGDITSAVTALGVEFMSNKNIANGYAGLDATGKVNSSILPSYVDDVLELDTYADLPVIGEGNKIYIVVADETKGGDTSSYRWTGSIYAMVSNTLTAADVKALYESNANTNAYTDAEKLEVAVSTVHNTSDGSDHTFIDQDVTTTGTPVFASVQVAGGTGDEGRFTWNADESTLDVALNGATLQVGQEQLIRVTNNSGTSINDGMAVMATGTLGNSDRITVAKATLTQANAKFILGIVTETIASGADGFVTAFGKVRGIQTNGVNYGETWVDGDVLYVKDSGNGALTKVVPTDTQVKLPVAIVISAHGSNGTLFVRVNSIDENHAKAELALKASINSPTLVTPNIGVATGTSFNSITGLASVAPLAAGTAAVGVSTLTARQDHVHPIQTTISGNAGTATKLATARNIALTGDITGNINFDGSANVSIATTIAANSVALGTDTTGNYVVGNTAGTGIVVTGTAGEGWSPTITLSNVGTSGTYRSVTTDTQGRITAGTNPTTVAGYGLTDVYTKTQIDTNIGTVAEFEATLN